MHCRRPRQRHLREVRRVLREAAGPRVADLEAARALRALLRRPGHELAAPLAWLVTRDQDPRVLRSAFLLLVLATRHPSLGRVRLRALFGQLLPWLLAALRDSTVTEGRRLALLPLAALAGGDPTRLPPSLRAHAPAVEAAWRDRAEARGDTAWVVERLLEAARLVDEDELGRGNAARMRRLLALGAALAAHGDTIAPAVTGKGHGKRARRRRHECRMREGAAAKRAELRRVDREPVERRARLP